MNFFKRKNQKKIAIVLCIILAIAMVVTFIPLF